MVILLALSGLLAFVIGVVWLLIALIAKKNKRRPFFILLGGILLFFSGILINNGSSHNSVSNSTITIDKETTESSISNDFIPEIIVLSPFYDFEQNTFEVTGVTGENQKISVELPDGNTTTITAESNGRFSYSGDLKDESFKLKFFDVNNKSQEVDISSINDAEKEEAEFNRSIMQIDLENVVEEEDQKIKEILFDTDTMIIHLDYVEASSEDRFFKDFVDTSGRIFEYLKDTTYDKNFKNIIITKLAEFTDNKGNSNPRLTISSLYNLKTIEEINYDKWLDLIFIEPSIFFELSEAYYIDLRLYDGISNEYLNIDDTDSIIDNSKTIENTIYDKYGYPTF